MRVFELPAGLSAREQGRAHGETFAPLIREIGEIRVELSMVNGRFTRPEDVMRAATPHLALLERWDSLGYEELVGIAEGAGVSPELVVVLNHYTDLRDLDPADFGAPQGEVSPEDDDECSLVFARTPDGVVLGETWDTHASVMPYVMMMRVPEAEGVPAAWIFTITGCLGMSGLNSHGVGCGINNLKSTDARVGAVWSAIVRRALRRDTAAGARDEILGAPLGSGHHYFVASPEAGYGIETSGERKAIVFDDAGDVFVHTNHCFDSAVGECSLIKEGSTTLARYDTLTRGVEAEPITDWADLWRRFGSHEGYPKSVCTHLAGPKSPHAVATNGAVVMDLSRRELWATTGCVHYARPTLFDFDDFEGLDAIEPEVG